MVIIMRCRCVCVNLSDTGENFFHNLGLSAATMVTIYCCCYNDHLLLLLWWLSAATMVTICCCCYNDHLLLLLWWLSAAAMVTICCCCYNDHLLLLLWRLSAAAMVTMNIHLRINNIPRGVTDTWVSETACTLSCQEGCICILTILQIKIGKDNYAAYNNLLSMCRILIHIRSLIDNFRAPSPFVLMLKPHGHTLA